MKTGRPKKLQNAKSRRHTIILNEEAERIFRLLSKERKSTKWLHHELSEMLIKRYNNSSYQIDIIKKEIGEITVQIDQSWAKRDELRKKLDEMRCNNDK